MRAKMKTCKAVSKRFKVSGTGKILYQKAGRRHLLTGKSAKRMRPLRRQGQIDSVDAERITRLLPYGTP